MSTPLIVITIAARTKGRIILLASKSFFLDRCHTSSLAMIARDPRPGLQLDWEWELKRWKFADGVLEIQGVQFGGT